MVAQALTDAAIDDATTGVGLVDQVNGEVASVIADTAYDTVAFYEDRTVGRVQVLGRRRWKKATRYHRQARVETAVFRYKSIIGPGLRARTTRGRQTEALLACNVLNRMTELGRPASFSVGR